MQTQLMPASAVTDIVWIQTGFIGDIILTTAAIALARRFLPAAKQHIITTAIGAQVLAGHADLTSCIVYAKKGQAGPIQAMRDAKRQLTAALSEPGPQGGVVVLQAHRSTRSSLLARFLRKTTVTYRQTAAPVYAKRRVERVAVLHEAQRIALLLAPLGVPRSAIMTAAASMPRLALPEGSAWGQRLRAWSGPVVAIAPGSVWGTKRWTEAGFAEILRRLLARPDVLVVLLGSGAEVEVAGRIAATAPGHPRLLNLAGQTSFADLKALYPYVKLLIANDSSPIHMASAYGVSTVALFGATVPAMGFGPLAAHSVSLGIELDCRPCSDHGPQVCPLGHFKCMRELGADLVWSACVERLPAYPS